MQLTQEQAYLAMYAFLDKQFSLGWDELGGILGSMSLLPMAYPLTLRWRRNGKRPFRQHSRHC